MGKQVAAHYDNGDGGYKERWDGMTGDERGRGGRDGDDVRPFYSRERTLRARNVTGAKRCRGTSAGRCAGRHSCERDGRETQPMLARAQSQDDDAAPWADEPFACGPGP
jgi:hypothetical protein